MTIPRHEQDHILAIAREVRQDISGMGLCREATFALSTQLTQAHLPHEIWIGEWRDESASKSEKELTAHKTWMRKWLLGDEEAAEKVLSIAMHVWIEFPQYERAILDTTADQFGNYPTVWFPAERKRYRRFQKLEPEELEMLLEDGVLSSPRICPAHLRRRPVTVRGHIRRRVARHLSHPPGACLCHRSKTVDRARRGLARRLR